MNTIKQIIEASNPSYDHADESYIVDHPSIAIHCSGYYTIAELEYKLNILKEANTAFQEYTK